MRGVSNSALASVDARTEAAIKRALATWLRPILPRIIAWTYLAAASCFASVTISWVIARSFIKSLRALSRSNALADWAALNDAVPLDDGG